MIPENNPTNSFLEVSPDNGSQISIKTYRTSKELEDTVQQTMELILMRYEKDHLLPILYTVMKELIINACKANQKRVFFEEHSLDILNPDDYKVGIKEYKKVFSENMGDEYGPKCKQKDYYCLIIFDYDEDGITIEVRNNTLITREEEKSLREKLANAMAYDDLAQFYMENADNTEGAGLGLALIIIMLKGENIDPNYFRISIKDEYTSARLELPFTDNFRSKREH